MDIANGTAHRKRNKGKIYDSIYFSILNQYKIDEENHVIGYNGILNDEWLNECLKIGNQFSIKITPIISIELAICMFSIIHRSEYITDNNSKNKEISIRGSIEIVTNQNSVSILTSDDINRIPVCFMKISNVKVFREKSFMMDVVETYRKGGFLYLKDKEGDILKVTKRK